MIAKLIGIICLFRGAFVIHTFLGPTSALYSCPHILQALIHAILHLTAGLNRTTAGLYILCQDVF
jgi:hypothetical protein